LKENRARHRAEYGGRLPNWKCDYCYGRRKNNGKITPLEVNDVTRGEFEQKKPMIVRLGKLTEVGHPFYRKQLLDFLELCREFGTSVIFPTKMLEYDERVAKLLRETRSVLNYGIGNDSLERGACSQGFKNEKRIWEAWKYHMDGVNTTLTIACDVTSSMGDNVGRGFAVGKAMDFRGEIPRRLLPMRINKVALAWKIAGEDWHKLIYRTIDGEDKLPLELHEVDNPGRYIQRGNNELIPRIYHPDFRGFVGSCRVCSRIGEIEYCDGCHLDGALKQCFPASEIAEVQYNPGRSEDMRRYRQKKRRDKRQGVLF
jgi:hypothetical protein